MYMSLGPPGFGPRAGRGFSIAGGARINQQQQPIHKTVLLLRQPHSLCHPSPTSLRFALPTPSSKASVATRSDYKSAGVEMSGAVN